MKLGSKYLIARQKRGMGIPGMVREGEGRGGKGRNVREWEGCGEERGVGLSTSQVFCISPPSFLPCVRQCLAHRNLKM